MRNLPSQREKLVELAKKKLEITKELGIYEPCNCGNRVQHNNGGNYHQEIYLAIDKGRYFVKYETTCELVAPAEWSETTKEKAMEIIEQHGDWLKGYHVTIPEEYNTAT